MRFREYLKEDESKIRGIKFEPGDTAYRNGKAYTVVKVQKDPGDDFEWLYVKGEDGKTKEMNLFFGTEKDWDSQGETSEKEPKFKKGDVAYLSHGSTQFVKGKIKANYTYEKVKVIKVEGGREVGIQQGDVDTLYTIEREDGDTLEVQGFKLSKNSNGE